MGVNMNENLPLLNKSNEMMQLLLRRFSIGEVMEEQSDFFIEQSSAQMICVFVKQEAGYTEFVFERDKTLSSLMKQLNFNRNKGVIAEALSNATGGVTQLTPYRRINALCLALKGVVPDKSCRTFVVSSGFREAILLPLQLRNGKQIGCVSYCFTKHNGDAEPHQLKLLTQTLESAIVPLFDEETEVFYSRYIHVDDEMQKLTHKEREIVERVLEGETYPVIAEAIDISINTLKTHMKNIFAKYGVSSKLELQSKIINK